MNQPAGPQSLKHLYPGWFAITMGLCGLSLAWRRAEPLLGEPSVWISSLAGLLAALVFSALSAAFVMRANRFPSAWQDDKRHPVRHTFIAAIPISLLLLGTVAVAAGMTGIWVAAMWWAGSIAQFAVTLWVLSKWLRGNQAGGFQWASMTPAIFIPIVGNVLVPLAGFPLGYEGWSAAQFGVGLLFWPVALALLITRIALQGMWPERLLPATFILIAPPAVVGIALQLMGAPSLVVWALWGMSFFAFLWSASLAVRIAGLPFDLPHWGMSFPLAALTVLTLRLPASGPTTALGMALLALTSLLIGALSFATINGLRRGTLLVPEPLPAVVTAVAAQEKRP